MKRALEETVTKIEDTETEDIVTVVSRPDADNDCDGTEGEDGSLERTFHLERKVSTELPKCIQMDAFRFLLVVSIAHSSLHAAGAGCRSWVLGRHVCTVRGCVLPAMTIAFDARVPMHEQGAAKGPNWAQRQAMASCIGGFMHR